MSVSRTRRISIAAALACAGVAFAGSSIQLTSARAQSAQSAPASTATPPATSDGQQQSAASSNAPEMDQNEAPLSLRARAELVPVRVVVRDADGHVIANLKKDDFEIFEDRKQQVISNFIVEKLPSTPRPAAPSNITVESSSRPADVFAAPARFVALLFDDEFSDTQNLMLARNAAQKYLDVGLLPTDRVAVFTVSGRGDLDFTDDRAKLREALARVQPHPVEGFGLSHKNECPPMDYYEADKIRNQNDSEALSVAFDDVVHCDPALYQAASMAGAAGTQLSTADTNRAQTMVQTAAAFEDQQGAVRVQGAFRSLRAIVRRLAAMPGQRNLVLISPGFIFPDNRFDYTDVVDLAIRSNVFISTLDLRGLYAPDMGGDIANPPSNPDPAAAGPHAMWRVASQSEQGTILAYLAADTGGNSFQNNNDLVDGFREVAAAPEVYYYLAFAPQNLKYDGKFHALKVTLHTKEKYTVQARRGYYAPLHGTTPADAAKQDIEDAVFSQEEQHGLPVALQTQFYKTDPEDAKVSVLAHVDLAHIHFEKAEGRNENDLTVVAALFDRNGNFITGTQKTVVLKLRDETLERLSRTGVTVRTNFDVKPGDYVVRLVVRDSKAAQLSAENGVVQIPY